jgi:acyl-CoA synthetase (AMP-forming)/AMP-acid ligase II
MAFTAEVYAGQVLGMTEADICFSASKLSFAHGLGNSLSFPLFHGASVVLHPHASMPADVMRIIAEYRPTLFFDVPTLYHLLLKALMTLGNPVPVHTSPPKASNRFSLALVSQRHWGVMSTWASSMETGTTMGEIP